MQGSYLVGVFTLPQLLEAWLPALVFAAIGLPLIIEDVRHSSVPLGLLVGAFAAWLGTALILEGSTSRLLASSIVLVLGWLLIVILPDRLGEADVVFMSGMALLLPFWSLLFALILSCVGSLAAFAWLSRGGRGEFLTRPLPFLPSLYWGGLAILLGGMLL
jgi:Flp pilus assembly protein protease CpaA